MEGKQAVESIRVSGLQPGYIIGGRYELTNLIARGGMGAVYRARHITLDKPVAVKVLRAGEGDAVTYQRFRSEAKAAAALNHPHVINVQDYGQLDDGSPYIVMEYIEGRALSSIIKEDGPLEEKRAVKLFTQICEGLAHAHARGVIHRDLKPSNIVLVHGETGEELAKIVDFGVAKRLMEDQHLTKTGQVFGTPLYMSPEQCAAKPMDVRSDVYSLGCLMFETLAGRTPFHADSPLETMFKHCSEPAPPVNAVRTNPAVTMHLEEIIDKCLCKHPDGRFQSVVELHDALLGKRPVHRVEEPAATLEHDAVEPPAEVTQQTTRVYTVENAALSESGASQSEPTEDKPPISAPAISSRRPLFIGGGLIVLCACVVIGFQNIQNATSTVPPIAVPDKTVQSENGISASGEAETSAGIQRANEQIENKSGHPSHAAMHHHLHPAHIAHHQAKPSLWRRFVNGFKRAF